MIHQARNPLLAAEFDRALYKWLSQQQQQRQVSTRSSFRNKPSLRSRITKKDRAARVSNLTRRATLAWTIAKPSFSARSEFQVPRSTRGVDRRSNAHAGS